MHFLLKLGNKKILPLALIFFLVLAGIFYYRMRGPASSQIPAEKDETGYWFLLKRKSNFENLYYGRPGDRSNSRLVKTFFVKTGIPGESPTPLPQLAGKEYWLIINKESSEDNPETAPYFLTLNIPVGEEEPYGPTPYLECNGQCNWKLPGYFGLHGVNNDDSKLAADNPGSSGCVRHRDEDISFLYNILDPQKTEVRYYIDDV